MMRVGSSGRECNLGKTSKELGFWKGRGEGNEEREESKERERGLGANAIDDGWLSAVIE